MACASDKKITVLLLKTKSSPGDSYEDILSANHDGISFEPIFIPVLKHRFEVDGMNEVGNMLRCRQIGSSLECKYGGLIFTSQRAVEAFAQLVQEGNDDCEWPHLQQIPIYSVGPATTRALMGVRQLSSLSVHGDHTGNGDSLAKFILEHYTTWYEDRATKPALLFLVGETRRDIIPKTLMSAELADDRRIRVDEIVVYGTGVMESFASNLASQLASSGNAGPIWAVVFSPTGCDSLLRTMGVLDDNGKFKGFPENRLIFVATIGPTTRDHLRNTFGFEPDVCAEKPSPIGVLSGILHFIRSN